MFNVQFLYPWFILLLYIHYSWRMVICDDIVMMLKKLFESLLHTCDFQ